MAFELPTYHTGGLAPGEITAKLKKAERVLNIDQTKVFDRIINKVPSFNYQTENIRNLITNNYTKTQTQTADRQQGQQIMIHIPVNVEGRKQMASEMKKEIENTVIDVIRRYN